jgi:hypothetical protein
MARGGKGGTAGFAGAAPVFYTAPGPPAPVRPLRVPTYPALDMAAFAALWVCPVVCVLALVVPLSLLFYTSPHSAVDSTLYLQAGTPGGEMWLQRLPPPGSFTSSSASVQQLYGYARPTLVAQLAAPPQLSETGFSRQTPIIPQAVVTGGDTPGNWQWQGYSFNYGAGVVASFNCSIGSVNVCVAASDAQFAAWESAALSGTAALSALDANCNLFAHGQASWFTDFRLPFASDTFYVILVSMDVGSPAWTAYNAPNSRSAQPPLAPTAVCQLAVAIVDTVYAVTVSSATPTPAGAVPAAALVGGADALVFDRADGEWLLFQAPNGSDPSNTRLTPDGLTVEADQYTIQVSQNLSFYGSTSFLLAWMAAFLAVSTITFALSLAYLTADCCAPLFTRAAPPTAGGPPAPPAVSALPADPSSPVSTPQPGGAPAIAPGISTPRPATADLPGPAVTARPAEAAAAMGTDLALAILPHPRPDLWPPSPAQAPRPAVIFFETAAQFP